MPAENEPDGLDALHQEARRLAELLGQTFNLEYGDDPAVAATAGVAVISYANAASITEELAEANAHLRGIAASLETLASAIAPRNTDGPALLRIHDEAAYT